MRTGPVTFFSFLSLFAIAAAGMAAPAAAGFQPTRPAWGGFYMGVQGGYGWGETTTVESPDNAAPYNGAGNSWTGDSEGMLGGLHMGVDWESYALILGVELAGGYLAVEGEAADPNSAGLDTVALGGNGYYGEITGRIGFAPDRMLYYMKGGAAFADLGLEVTDGCSVDPCGAGTIAASDDGIRDGWTMGAGLAYAFPNNLSLRLEYAWYEFRDVPVVGTIGADSYAWEQDVNFQTVTLGLSFLF